MYFKDDGFSVGKKIDSKPYESLCESAQTAPYGVSNIVQGSTDVGNGIQ